MKLRAKEIRTRKGLSQQEVANRLGMPIRRYGSYERGERTLSLIDAARIADVFGCSLDELAGRDFRPAGGFSDQRQTELNRVWGQIGEQRRDRLLETAHDFEALERGRAERTVLERDAG